MFVLELTYTAPLEDVDAVLEAHVAWLDEQYEKGLFLASGRKNSRDGGVIIAVAEDLAGAERIVAATRSSPPGCACTASPSSWRRRRRRPWSSTGRNSAEPRPRGQPLPPSARCS